MSSRTAPQARPATPSQRDDDHTWPAADHRPPGAAGLGWVGLALAVVGVLLVTLGVLPDGGRALYPGGYVALVTAALASVCGIVFDRARRAAVLGLLVALLGFALVATLLTS